MWIIGLLGFGLIYLIEFRWYMVSLIKLGNRPSSAPVILQSPFAHYSVHGLSVCIFGFSTYCFYSVNPWMLLISPALLFFTMIAHQAIQSRRTDRVIALAARIQISLERTGASRIQINDAICVATLGNGYDLGLDCDLKELLKHMILTNLGLLASSSSILRISGEASSAFETHEKECAEIDLKIESTLYTLGMRAKNL